MTYHATCELSLHLLRMHRIGLGQVYGLIPFLRTLRSLCIDGQSWGGDLEHRGGD